MALIKVIDSMTSGLALTAHSHEIADVSTLQTALEGKAVLGHTHVKADITDYNVAANLGATGVLAETIPRQLCSETSVTFGASGIVFLQAIYLMSGTVINNITIWSSTTAGATLSTSYASIYNGLNRVALSNPDTTASWAINTARTFTLSSAYTVPSNGVYYIGLQILGTTMPTIKGNAARVGGQLGAINPAISAKSGVLSAPAPSPLSTPTVTVDSIYASVS